MKAGTSPTISSYLRFRQMEAVICRIGRLFSKLIEESNKGSVVTEYRMPRRTKIPA